MRALSAALLSGSWAMVTDRADWSERTAAWVRGAVADGLPLLGVCYGHQLMSYALGGNVGDNPAGWERGLIAVTGGEAMRQGRCCRHFPIGSPPGFHTASRY